ncbi:MAG: hypothetical protein ACYC5M_13990 [Anaerolineae bacterium]
MEKRFRALRIVAAFFKILAWIALVGGILGTVLIVIVAAVQGNAGAPSPVLERLPMAGNLMGIAAGLLVGLVFLLGSLIYFVVLYAASESIQLGLAIEQNTRDSAYYLRGENQVSTPPVAGY